MTSYYSSVFLEQFSHLGLALEVLSCRHGKKRARPATTARRALRPSLKLKSKIMSTIYF